jgi:hypothetical protein
MPVAQTIVLRRVLKGGISADSGRVFFFLFSTDVFPLWGCPGTAGWGMGGLVFGTLLGPEATGPGRWFSFVGGCRFGFVCFWFPGCTGHAWFVSFVGACVWGVWYGVVV